MPTNNAAIAGRPSVLSALAHEALNASSYESLADLIDDIKSRAARLRIPYDGDAITEALAIVGRTRPLVGAPMPRAVETPPAPVQTSRPIRTLGELLDELPKQGYDAPPDESAVVRAMPKAKAPPDPDAEQAARERAWEMGIEL